MFKNISKYTNDILFFLMLIVILLLGQTKNYYIIGILPMFPLFLIITMFHYKNDFLNLKKVIISTLLNLIPYFIYLYSFYFFKIKNDYSFINSVIISFVFWLIAASLIYFLFKKVFKK